MSEAELLDVEEFENGGIAFRVYKYDNPRHNRFHLKIGGCCYLEIKEHELLQLWEFLNEYIPYEYPKKKRWWNFGR